MNQKYHIEIRICPIIEDGIDTSLAHRSILSQGDGWDKQGAIALSNVLAGYLDFSTGQDSVKSQWVDQPFFDGLDNLGKPFELPSK